MHQLQQRRMMKQELELQEQLQKQLVLEFPVFSPAQMFVIQKPTAPLV